MGLEKSRLLLVADWLKDTQGGKDGARSTLRLGNWGMRIGEDVPTLTFSSHNLQLVTFTTLTVEHKRKLSTDANLQPHAPNPETSCVLS